MTRFMTHKITFLMMPIHVAVPVIVMAVVPSGSIRCLNPMLTASLRGRTVAQEYPVSNKASVSW